MRLKTFFFLGFPTIAWWLKWVIVVVIGRSVAPRSGITFQYIFNLDYLNIRWERHEGIFLREKMGGILTLEQVFSENITIFAYTNEG